MTTSRNNPSIAYSITIRAQYPNRAGMLGVITSAIGEVEGDIGAIDTVSSSRTTMTRDITVNARNVSHGEQIEDRVRKVPGVRVLSVSDPVFLRHLGGKIEVNSRSPVTTRNDMSIVYTPGVGRVSMAIYHDPAALWTLTGKGNTVAVVTDGTAVLGLGDIGPGGAMPVMEGKAVLFKELAGVDAYPICLDTKDADEIVEIVKAISPGFGGVNLEDISAPRCFYVEQRLKDELDIPIFHDDQHGTAVVVLAGLINAVKINGKKMEDLKVVVNGVGASGIACAKILMTAGCFNIIGCDTQGIVYRGRDNRGNKAKDEFAEISNPDNIEGDLAKAMQGADVFLGLSGPNTVTPAMVKDMNDEPIVFAMANPDPEIWPEEAQGLARVMATGRSDYPNQINNALCFPGIFRGALDVRAREINEEMKLAAAQAIAAGVPNSDLNEDFIIPSIFDKGVVRRVAREVAAAAQRTGVARRSRRRVTSYSPRSGV
ncbi:MAG: NAD-dependent malic enzyme [Chloroflexota bacterium]|nr:NAD-dependent malic enzyme [Chloroflexota bacterium]